MTTTAPEVPVMDLSLAGQRAYCARLGIIPAGDDPLDAWYRDPACREVSRLLTEMAAQRDKMTAAARWIRSALDTAGRQFTGEQVHSAGLSSSGAIAQQALAHDLAVAVYCALENHLQQVVNDIRDAQGHPVAAFSRLEDHPDLPPAEDQAAASHVGMAAHDGYARHSHEVRADHEGVSRDDRA